MNINLKVFNNEEKNCNSCIHLDERSNGTYLCNLYMSTPNFDFSCNSFSPRIWWMIRQFNNENMAQVVR